MEYDYLNTNLYKAAFHAFRKNILLVLVTSLILVLLKISTLKFTLMSSWWEISLAVGYFASIIFLVIGFSFATQNTIVNRTSGIWQSLMTGRLSNKIKFFWHGAILIVIFLLVPILLALFALETASQLGFDQQDQNHNLTKLMALIVYLPLLGALFSTYGILLPSIVADDDVSFLSAFRRGKIMYWLSFSRFIVGPVALTLLAGKVSTILLMNGVSSSVFTISGILTSYVYYMFRLFLLTLAVTVLCETYLKSNERLEQAA